ncbi:MAG: tetratricopeptide repeat protein [Nitrospirae bacterium]|nr:tetratricopeptide repeat protein [Nitrospirota bacterium]
MKRAVPQTGLGASIYRAAAWGLLMTVGIGCAAVRSSGGSASPGASGKGSSESNTRSPVKMEYHSAYQQGLSYFEQGQLENAQRVFESLVRSNADRVELHNALGVLFKRRGMLDNAIAEYTTAISLSESPSAPPSGRVASPELYNNLAIAYREHGDFKKAEETYRRAITLDPKFATAYYNLGVLYDLYLNQPSDAMRNYREYEKLAGQNQTVDVWIADLEQRVTHRTGNAAGQP